MPKRLGRRLNNVNGWQRLGIIASSLWVLFMLVVAINQYNNLQDISEGLQAEFPNVPYTAYVQWQDEKSGSIISLFRPSEASLTDDEVQARANSILEKIRSGSIVPTKQIAYWPLFVSICVPILAFWLLAYLLVFLYRWVRDGFRQKDQREPQVLPQSVSQSASDVNRVGGSSENNYEELILGQKYANYAFLGYIIGVILVAAHIDRYGVIPLICTLLLMIDIYAMAKGLRYGSWSGIGYAAMMIFPFLNILALIILSTSATRTLRRAGYSVGLFGVKGYKRRA